MAITISKMIYGVIAFTFVMFAFTQVYADFTNKYNIQHDANSSFSKAYNQINSTFGLAQEGTGELYNAGTTQSNAFDNMLNGGFSVIRIFMNSFDIVKEIIYAIQDQFGIPHELIILFLTIILLVILFSATNAIFRTGGV